MTLGGPHGLSPPGFSVQGILQARILECGAVPFSRVFLTQIEPQSPAFRQILYSLSQVSR